MESDDEIAQRIAADLADMNERDKLRNPAWIKCTVVVIEDMEAHPEGTNVQFLSVPRVGEFVVGFGEVKSVSHSPMVPDGSTLPFPYVTLFVQSQSL